MIGLWVTPLRLSIVAVGTVSTSSTRASDDTDTDVDEPDEIPAGDAPTETPDHEIPTTGVGAFVFGDGGGEWVESDAAVSLGRWA